MEKIPRCSEIARHAGLSRAYASQILRGLRTPSLPLAAHIYVTVGWRHPVLDGFAHDSITEMHRLRPWVPREAAANQKGT